jgi:DNA polymerase III subunit epsilon
MELERCGSPRVDLARMVDTIALARIRHPGAKLSLDALCTRYGIDRSHRTKHGALLDAELLAQLYIELTGGKQIGLELADDASAERRTEATRESLIAGERPFRSPRPHTASDADLERHRQFVATIQDALWNGRETPAPN